MKFANKILLVLLVLGMVSAVANAVIVAEYDFNEASAASIDTHTGTTASDYTYNVGGISGGVYDKYAPASQISSTLADAIANNEHDSITITHVSDVWSWDTFDFEYKIQNIWSDFTVYLLVDADSTGWDTGDELGNFLATGTTGDTVVNDVSFDISSLADLTSGSVEFRLYYTDNSGGGDRLHRVDDVTVNAIPEPATISLLVFGGLLLRRKRA